MPQPRSSNRSKSDPIRFLDLKDRNRAERARIKRRIVELEKSKVNPEPPDPGPVGGTVAAPPGTTVTAAATVAFDPNSPNGRYDDTPDEERELAYLIEHQDDDVVDRLFIEVQAVLSPGTEILHKDGLLPSQQQNGKRLTAAEKEIAAVYGTLARDNVRAPGAPWRRPADQDRGERQRFSRALARARADYNNDKALFDDVFAVVVSVGDQPGRANDDVRAEDWAAVSRTLSEQGAEPGQLYTRFQAQTALANLRGGDDGQPPSTLDIDLPDLEKDVAIEIIADNLQATQALYFSAMLEELRLYQVADKLVELFNQGLLPLGKGTAGDLLFAYWRESNQRFTEVERLNLYARVFGMPVGEPMAAGTPNRDFESRWLHFVSAVSSYFRQLQVDDLLRSNLPGAVSQEQVRKSGRDLAANLSLFGYGVAFFAATDLQDQIRDILELLDTDDIKGAYGAKDLWQVVDQVNALELPGGPRSTVRYRTMATAGSIIIRWLSQHPVELSSSNRPVLDRNAVISGGKASKPMRNPTDRDLVDACETYLAVTGTPDVRVEEYAQPIESPNYTSRPVQIPAVARDVLESVGVGV
jgi:hypothetical protein